MFRTHVEKGYNVEVNQGCTLSVEPFQSLLNKGQWTCVTW